MKISIWNNLIDLYKQTPILYVGLRNPFMVSSKPLGVGMPKWITFFYELAFLGVILTILSTPRKWAKSLIILVLYDDDLIVTGSDANLINHVKSILKKRFQMIDLGHLHYFLGLQVL